MHAARIAVLLIASHAAAEARPVHPLAVCGPPAPNVRGHVEEFRRAGLMLVTFRGDAEKAVALPRLGLVDAAPALVGPEAICAWEGAMDARRLNRIAATAGVVSVEVFVIGGGA